MKLERFAVISLSDPAPDRRDLVWSYKASNGLTVTLSEIIHQDDDNEPPPSDEVGSRILFAPAELGIHLVVSVTVRRLPIHLDELGRPKVPAAEREAAEQSIEEFADLLAVVHQCRRSISSPALTVRLRPEQGESFSNAGSTAEPIPHIRTPARVVDAPNQSFKQLLNDRLEGVQLLAASLSTTLLTESARNIFLLFEAAFSRPIGKLAHPLYSFLYAGEASGMDITKREVQNWEQSRHAVMHTDRSPYNPIDAETNLPRLQWAAYDVLLNKKQWRNKSWERRDGLSLRSGVTADGQILNLHPDRGLLDVLVPDLDKYGAFPTNANAQLEVNAPGVNDKEHDWRYSPTISAMQETQDS